MKKVVAVVLVLALLISVLTISTFAISNQIKYTFSGANKDKAGYAQGTISYTGSEKVYLYWANEVCALPGYYEIGSLLSNESITLGDHVVIPVGATKLIASTSNTAAHATVNSAQAVYDIPYAKQLDVEGKQYTFQTLSDIHIDMQGGGYDTYYEYSVSHFKNALEKANNHKVDFIVSAGDEITNATGATLEWLTYQECIAKSNYANPIYEAIGNHETRRAKYSECDVKCGLEEFMLATGLDKESNQVVADKTYYEYTQETTGDHFIFMSLENGYSPNEVDEFSNDQITWLANLLQKYFNDGHKIFLIQHSPIYGYGAGDYNSNPAYGGTLKMVNPDTGEIYVNNQKFKSLIEKYRNVVWISGHTHIDFRDDVNYSNENGTSCYMIHVPSCVNTTRIIPSAEDPTKNDLDRTFYEDTTQGYYVDVYDDVSIWNATNLYHDMLYPQYSYIIGEGKGKEEPTTEESTQFTTESITEETVESTEPSPKVTYGDANCDKKVTVLDVTKEQQHLANIELLSLQGIINGDVNGDKKIEILDATIIQQYLAQIIKKFPVEEIVQVGTFQTKDSVVAIKAKKYLDVYYQYASYSQYLELKRAYNSGVDKDIESAIINFDILHNRVWADTVYFTDITQMNYIWAYAWKNSPLEAWPGQEATYIKTNSHGQNVWAVTIDYTKFNKIIFNNGGQGIQTVDIELDGKSGKGYYTAASSDKLPVIEYIFNQMWYNDI